MKDVGGALVMIRKLFFLLMKFIWRELLPQAVGPGSCAKPPKDLKVHSGPPVTHGGLHRQHQRKVKNTQSYEFYHFPKHGSVDFTLL